MPTKKLTITGRVQGVLFRATAKEKADDLGITGWVRNDLDGTVRVLVQGDEGAVTSFIEWCHEGPESAVVEQVQVSDSDEEDSDSFDIRRLNPSHYD